MPRVEAPFVDPVSVAYFLQSRTLFLACRRLPEPHPGAAAQIKDLWKWVL